MKRLFVALLVIVAIAGAPMSVAAQADDGVIDDLLDGEDDGLVSVTLAYVDGQIDRFFADESDETAAEAAQQTQTAFNGNASTIQAWVNNHTGVSNDSDVVSLTFEIGDGSETVHLTSNATADGYRNASMVDMTSRTVDESCTLEGYAAHQADHELAVFVEEFAKPNETMTQSYLAELVGAYSEDVECSFGTNTEE